MSLGLMLHISRSEIVSMSKVVVSLCIVLAASRAVLALFLTLTVKNSLSS